MRLAAILVLLAALASAQKTYPLQTWNNLSCRGKGRFQDREYCSSEVIDHIVADDKSAIPILISQITDKRWIAEPVYDFQPPIQAGTLAHLILRDLFLDDTWTKSTMPPLFADNKTHSLAETQAAWRRFWTANQDHIYWDAKARCFRLNN
jgi:hypothetical protein